MPALPETIQTERLALSADHWNKGMITEAVRAVCDCAFENVAELNRIRAWADSRNAGSLRVMEKLGMTREGYLRQHKVIRGELVDAAKRKEAPPLWQGFSRCLCLCLLLGGL